MVSVGSRPILVLASSRLFHHLVVEEHKQVGLLVNRRRCEKTHVFIIPVTTSSPTIRRARIGAKF